MREDVGVGVTCVVCRSLYGITDFGIQAIADVDDGGCFFEHTEGFDQWGRESFRGTADVKVLE